MDTLMNAQHDAMVCWNNIVGWSAGSNHYFDPDQILYQQGEFVDVIFDGAYNGERRCLQDEQHCTPPMPDTYRAGSTHFPDLNFQVVVWNLDWLFNVDPNAQVDNVSIFQYVMRHELGHDYFLSDTSSGDCGWLMSNCDDEADLQPEELATANDEYNLRPQAPTDVWVTQRTATSITVQWTGAQNYIYFFPYYTTTPYSGWQQYGYEWAGTTLTFSDLPPNTTYYFRIVAAASGSLKSSSWPIQAKFGCSGDQDCDRVGDWVDNCVSTYNPDQKASRAGPRPTGPYLPSHIASNPANDRYGDVCDPDPPITFGICSQPGDGDGDTIPDCIEHRYVTCAYSADPMIHYSSCATPAESDGDNCPDWLEMVDVNGDRKVDSGDQLIVAKRVARLIAPEPTQDAVLDVNHDGKFDSGDNLMVAKNCSWQRRAFSRCGPE